jgi:serine/threonine-protein kinase
VAVQKRIGKYEILDELGRGGFAVVYKARDTILNRIVALKVLHPQLTTDPTFVQRFHQEAQTAARLHHPHIVTIYEVGKEAGQHYLAMTFLPGRTLDERLSATRGPLPVELAISITEQIAEALDTIHQQGLVHRDVKPANVVVDSKGRSTLLDFGIVRAAEGTRLTTTMAILGTPEYMAPEQAELEEGVDVDWRADIYALGVVAYEMLVGRPPFCGKSPTAILHKHVYQPPPAPTALNSTLPARLEPLLLKALAKRRERRFQQAGDFAAALRRTLLTESEPGGQETQLAPLYDQIQAAVTRKDWTEVLALGSQIEALDASYRDVAQLLERARQQAHYLKRAPTPPPPAQPAPRQRAQEPERRVERTSILNRRVAGISFLTMFVCVGLMALVASGVILVPRLLGAVTDTADVTSSTETPTAEPPPTQTPWPTSTYYPISIKDVANASFDFAFPPLGDVTLDGVSFHLSDRVFRSQASQSPHDVAPTSALVMADVSRAHQVHLLLNTGNGFNRFSGQAIGQIWVTCDGTSALLTDLVLGLDIREWHIADNVVSSASRAHQVWRGDIADLPGETGHIDMLSLDLPAACQDGKLTAIEIVDTSVDAVGSLDPGLSLSGIAIEYYQ